MGLENRALEIVLEKIVALLGIFPKLRDAGFNIADITHTYCMVMIGFIAAYKVIEDRCGFIKEEWEIGFNSCRRNTSADIFIDRTTRGVPFKILAPASSKGGT